jgi:ABC-type phosphonate transport system ATPase subunit
MPSLLLNIKIEWRCVWQRPEDALRLRLGAPALMTERNDDPALGHTLAGEWDVAGLCVGQPIR